MSKTLYYNGKIVTKLPKSAIHLWTEFTHNVYYGDKAYKEQQDRNNHDFFQRMREQREDLERRHG